MKATNIYQKLKSAGAISPLHQEDPPGESKRTINVEGDVAPIETQQEQGDITPVEPVNEVESSGPVDTYTKREGLSDATGFLGTRQDRLASAEAGKSLAAEAGAGVLAGALGASAGVGAGAMLGAAGARTLGNLAQNEVARRRVEKFGQEGSAIVPNLTYKQGGEGNIGAKALMGEKTYTGEDPRLERIKARNFRRKWRAEKRAKNKAERLAKRDAYKAERQKGREERQMIREGSPATFAKTNSGAAYSNATTVNPSALKSSPITQKAKQYSSSPNKISWKRAERKAAKGKGTIIRQYAGTPPSQLVGRKRHDSPGVYVTESGKEKQIKGSRIKRKDRKYYEEKYG